MDAKGINEFTIKFANVNGSGSASANNMFAKAVFRMGVPVAPRNIFPSNIQGSPTWYEVRISEKGYLGSAGQTVDIMLGINPQSMAADIVSVAQDGYFIYDNSKSLDLRLERGDITNIGIPLSNICNQQFSDPRQRQLFKNVIYVGALSALINVEFEILEQLIAEQFKGKEKLITPNIAALKLGRDYALKQFSCPLPLHLQRRDLLGDNILIDGNSATGLGAIYAGATVAAWYPITPSTSVVEAFERYAKQFRIDESGKKRYAVIQAEDEIASIGMAIGANWNGARAFTATSGPGVSLMNEFLGLAYFAEIPVVLIDVQRTGPSTGMPTRTQQSDVLSVAYASHGDTQHIVLIPSTPGECFKLTAMAFDVADRVQTPVVVLSDLELGMNESISEPLQWDDSRTYDCGKIVTREQLDNGFDFGRYLDIDGDGIAWRSIPGIHPDKAAVTMRGTSRNERAIYTEKSSDYEQNMQRLKRKFATALQYLPEPVITTRTDNNTNNAIGIIHYGTTLNIMTELIDTLQQYSINVNDLCLKCYPFHSCVSDFINAHEKVYVIEQNRDAQMRSLLSIELSIDINKLIAVTHFDGNSIHVNAIIEQVNSIS